METLTISDHGQVLHVAITTGIALLAEGFIAKHPNNDAGEHTSFFVVPHEDIPGWEPEMWSRLHRRITEIEHDPHLLNFSRGRCTKVVDDYVRVFVSGVIESDDEVTESGEVIDGFAQWCDADNNVIEGDLADVLEAAYAARFPGMVS